MSAIVKNSRVTNSLLWKLPEHYRNFYIQWKFAKPTPVHYQPTEVEWVRNPETGEVKRVQTRPIVLTFPKESNYGLWGGEGIIRGFVKRHPLRRRVPRFWFPVIQKAVVYSEILDKYMEITVTRRTLLLIDQHYGLDAYILETPPQDLQSVLGVKLKRELLLALVKKDFLPNNPAKREELYEKFKKHIIPQEEAEWYGLTLPEAKEKFEEIKKMEVQKFVEREPLKLKFRQEFLEQLKEKKEQEEDPSKSSTPTSWVSKLNPFRSNKSV